MSRMSHRTKGEKLDRMKSGKVGPRQKRGRVEIDLTGLPEDIVVAAIEGRLSPAERQELATKASLAAAAKLAQDRQARAAARQAISARPSMLKRDSGAMARILGAAGDWITTAEIRAALEMSHGLATQVLDRLWRRGELDKRLNPGRAENVKRASGAAACTFQYRRAQKETAPNGAA
jgi:hypothetical protein